MLEALLVLQLAGLYLYLLYIDYHTTYYSSTNYLKTYYSLTLHLLLLDLLPITDHLLLITKYGTKYRNKCIALPANIVLRLLLLYAI